MSTRETSSERSVVGPGIVIGLGLGGFFDGIVLHQILQWHHLVSGIYPPDSLENLQLNTLWDGLFHLAAYSLTLLGLLMLWSVLRRGTAVRSYRVLIGAMLIGWGIFNVLDSVINHYLLGIHHIRPGPDEAWYDLGFLVWGAAMLLGGWLLTRPRSDPASTDPNTLDVGSDERR